MIKLYNDFMKCQVKAIKSDETQDCTNDAVGMFKTRSGNFPFCQAHADWAKMNRIVIRRSDNYYGNI